MTKPEISIICPAFNRPDELNTTIQWLRANVTIPYEFLIYDNSPEPLKECLNLQSKELYQHMGSNLGAEARNVGVFEAKASYILMLDDDSHPLPGAVEFALKELSRTDESVVGLMGNIKRPCGAMESSLLPTVYQGCGVLFKTEALRRIGNIYPQDFVYYGEEYWLTMLLYKYNYTLAYCDELKICHRSNKSKENLSRIFYYLGRNNAAIWHHFAPEKHLRKILYDSQRRYELIAKNEGVETSFYQGLSDAIKYNTEARLTDEQFRSFSLLDKFDEGLNGHPPKKVALCGTGKFPSFWADYLKGYGIEDVKVFDFNKGLAGHAIGEYEIESESHIERSLDDGYTPIVGHSSIVDANKWKMRLIDTGVTPVNIN
ncbi:MAG: glycosyltransferase family 2 protein [Lentisphaeria bacterium]|nr:glycosyltransferase family 2 protein [Lentisphaeria bacterium]NQZ69602.1 glycosyltransferase family 2 protein [Lentisphaeria bacterium]